MALDFDLRECIALLEGTSGLLRIEREVDSRYELAALAKKLDYGPAILFQRVKGYDVPVLCNLTVRRERVFQLFGLEGQQAFRALLSRGLKNPIKPVQVDSGPCQEVKVEAPLDLMRLFPIPWHALGDAGPYITSGMFVAKDPETGIRNLSIHRLQVKGPDRAGMKIDEGRHLGIILDKARQRGQNLEVAVAIGLHPALLLGGTAMGAEASFGRDEYELIGGIIGRPLELVRARTVALEVPASAEIVLEGEILHGEMEDEGPFGEYTGYYSPREINPVVRFRAATHRRNPIYYDIVSSERWMLKALMQEPLILEAVQRAVPIVQDLCMTMGGCGKHHVVVSVYKTRHAHEGLQRNAILSIFHALKDADLVIAVDEDVDIYDPQDVEWALATRFDAAEDLILISGARSHEINPITKAGIRGKLGLDATLPFGDRDRFERVKYMEIEPRDYL